MVQSRYFQGTIFSIDVDKREYWITAKHILTGAEHPPYGSVKEKKVALRVLNPGGQGEEWITQNFSVIDPGNGIDIVVLVPERVLLRNFPESAPASDVGVIFGDDCRFLGFPYGAWRANFGPDGDQWMPYTKRCTISAMITADHGRAWLLDGTNNPGFSGGPVIFGPILQEKIFAVVSSYATEPAEVIPSDPKAVAPVKVNVSNGFFLAYDISYALDAIHKNPIGPLFETAAPRASH